MTAPPSPGQAGSTRRIDLNLVQVAAAALAAVTAAVLGSMLGAAGTLIGAAGASAITTIGTAVYRASLERSTARVRTLAQRARLLSISHEGIRTEHSQVPPGDQLTDRPRSSDRFRRFATLRWGAMIGGALGGFVLAMGVITGFEAASGETLGGNGGGTTIGRVVEGPPDTQSPVVAPAQPSSSEPTSVTPTETSAPSSSASPTSSPPGSSVAPSPSPTSGTPAPNEVSPTTTLLPPRFPGLRY